MKLGYSFWGFLGNGIVDTPDGGRSHRRTLIDGLISAGHTIVFLQQDRDRIEAADPVELVGATWSSELPTLELLWLEWRWPIPGRNLASDAMTPGFTPDLMRQRELLSHYTDQGLPTIVWDKDLQISVDDPIRRKDNVKILEPALKPCAHAGRLLFPLSDEVLDEVVRNPPTFGHGSVELVYVGNQYDRNEAFDTWFAGPAANLSHRVLGKWPDRQRWPDVNFQGRVGFAEVGPAYQDAVATVLLLPERYARVGQMTQRLFEALLNGCAALLPPNVFGGEQFVHERFHLEQPDDVITICRDLRRNPPSSDETREWLLRLDAFRLSAQLSAAHDAMAGLIR